MERIFKNCSWQVLQDVCLLAMLFTYESFLRQSGHALKKCKSSPEGLSPGHLRCRYAETWAGFIAEEIAEQNLHEARALYKRAFGRKLEENGQVDVRAVH